MTTVNSLTNEAPDTRVRFYRPDNTCYAVLSMAQIREFRKQKKLDEWLANQRESGLIVDVNDDNVPSVVELAANARHLISQARTDGLVIDDFNVIDLLADNLTKAPLEDLRTALVVAGYAHEFPKATSPNRFVSHAERRRHERQMLERDSGR